LAIRAVGIRSIITIHESPLPGSIQKYAESLGIACFHFEVEDRYPPSIEQTLECCKLIEERIKYDFNIDELTSLKIDSLNASNKAKEYSNALVDSSHGVLIHCLGGVGRTNTIIIAYIMYRNSNLSAAEAIQKVIAIHHSPSQQPSINCGLANLVIALISFSLLG
jgi:hypothetical protein